ncbi:hypothetical protein [Picrophilus oshimae]|uniref:Hypothetical membrane spanning protein n=1 Tax=Picrophilus torridus (strain ATCC 700027 / DSM 9790 / JCM 10055 / NBRC 100828 / KAW 2/3) TaxID=1122961 RepID=Q6KZA1_PICTO|nr:hypothetical protein [Picrophilus oshimae]AAT43951.1 hypothetical membrane spanning protein [Picrophilus oshimae DSM 9789]
MNFSYILYGKSSSQNMKNATEYSLISLIIQIVYILMANTIIKYYIINIMRLAIGFYLIPVEIDFLIIMMVFILSVYIISFSGKTSHSIELYVLMVSIITFFSNFIAFIPLIAAWIKIRDEYFERRGIIFY